MSKTHTNVKYTTGRSGSTNTARINNAAPVDGDGPKSSKMQSALSMHLNNLVQRTTKNLNTGVFTKLNPNQSPMLQTGIGFSTVKNKRNNDTYFDHNDR